jgi:hypothetical protein
MKSAMAGVMGSCWFMWESWPVSTGNSAQRARFVTHQPYVVDLRSHNTNPAHTFEGSGYRWT